MHKQVVRLKQLLEQARRRRTFKAASLYAVSAWGATLAAASLLPAFGAPSWAVPVFAAIAVLGLPIAVALAWSYDTTPEMGEGAPATALAVSIEPPRAVREDATQLLGPSTVHVRWEDGRGVHERAFTRDFALGRDVACEVHFDDPMISRRHAQLSCADGLWWVTDLGSRNGTLLDGRRVEKAPLPGHCELRLHPDGSPVRLEIRSAPDAQTMAATPLHLTNE